ncbi:MAG TPA: energy transducer TonB [Rhizomicrobium sp.]|nr:energy transducer TonB [Rhizomicrobium sp.]
MRNGFCGTVALSALMFCASQALAQLDVSQPGITPPVATTSHVTTQSDYPVLSRELNEQGNVLVQYTVKEDGTVGDVSVVKSSGYPRLDDASVAMVKQRWLFKPATKDGKPIAVRNRANIIWKVEGPLTVMPDSPFTVITMKPEDYPAEARALQQEGYVGLVLVIGEHGEVLRSTITKSSGSPSLDAASTDFAKKQHFSPGQMNGKTVRTGIGLLVVWSLRDQPAPK